MMRRHVFYIHGFDPRGPAPYHALAVQAAEGRDVEVTARRKLTPISAGWELRTADRIVAYEVLRYDDWVRALWPRWSGARRHWAAWRVLIGFTRAGVMRRLARAAAPGFFAIVLQAVVAVLPLIGALVAGAAAEGLAGREFGFAAAAPWALAAALVAGWFWRRVDRRLNLAWYTRSLAYLLESARGEIRGPRERAGEFAARIVEVWRAGEADDILLVGHSLGSLLAIETLARALEREPRLGRAGPALSLLTLGQSAPIYARLDASGRFAADVRSVAAALPWVDVTSPRDAAASGEWPLAEAIVSLPTDHIDASARGWRAMLEPLEFHFRYLRAADPALGFDYLTTLCDERRALGIEQTRAA